MKLLPPLLLPLLPPPLLLLLPLLLPPLLLLPLLLPPSFVFLPFDVALQRRLHDRFLPHLP